MTVLQLAAAHPDRVAAIVMVDPAPFLFPPEVRAALESMAAAIEAGIQDARGKFIKNVPAHLRPAVGGQCNGSDVGSAEPRRRGCHTRGSRIRWSGGCGIVQGASTNLAATPPLNPPHLMSEWLPNVVNGWTVGAGHFNQLEVPEQINAMIEAFLRHYR